MKNSLLATLVLAGISLASSPLKAVPTLEIDSGRTALAAHDLTTALTHFKAAVDAEPDDETANALYGISRILALANSSEGSTVLNQMGISGTGRSIYHWRATRPKKWPSNLSTDNLKVAANEALPEIAAAEANLAKVTSAGFQLPLSAEETGLQSVTLDYGDILMLRAMARGATFTVLASNCINTGAKPADVEAWLKSNALTMQHLLQAYPNLLSSGSGALVTSGSQFSSFVNAYVSASEAIRARVSGTDANGAPFLFTINQSDWSDGVNGDRAGEEARFRNNLIQIQQALQGTVLFDGTTNLNVGSYVNATPAPVVRQLMPAFTYNHPAVSGTFPDPTFAGAVPGWTQSDALAAFTRLGHTLDRFFKHKDDAIAPTVKITSPKSHVRISATTGDFVNVAGTAKDDIGVTRVAVSLQNDSGLTHYVTTTGSNNSWNIDLHVAPGINTVTAIAYDAWENASKAQSIDLTYVVTGTLSITSGSGGKVVPNMSGTAELAKLYTVKAVPNPGYIFQGWYSDPSGWFWPEGDYPMEINPQLTFKMQDGYTAYAHFILNPYPAHAGNYNSVITQDFYDDSGNWVASQNTGFVTLSFNNKGAFSGKLTYGGSTFALQGALDSVGHAQLNVSRGKNAHPLWVYIDARFSDQTDTPSVYFEVFGDSDWSSCSATQCSGTSAIALCNKFTFFVSPNFDGSITHPQGTGYGTGSVDSKTRLARVAGKLPDGAPFTCSSNVDSYGMLPLYVLLYSGSGQFSGNLQFDSQSAVTEQHVSDYGLTMWSRPAITNSQFPDSWSITAAIDGSAWTTPTVTDNWLPSAWLFTRNLTTTQTLVDIGTKNQVIVTSDSNQLKLTIDFGAGGFQGSFVDPSTSTRIPFGGVLKKTGPNGAGFFLGNSINGGVFLTP